MPSASWAKTSPVLNGIDQLQAQNFAALKGLRIGLITNQTGINRQGHSTIDLLAQAPEVQLVALFSPEHGIRGKLDREKIDDSKDSKTGTPIFSLYKNKIRKPTTEQLRNLDALVFDIQDIGCRFYTYISTMGLCMEAAADAGLKFIVLDRVNPIAAERVDGPIRVGPTKFVAYHDIVIQHGMTIGELAKMINTEKKLHADLTIVPIQNWTRSQFFDSTQLPWINPSPNIRNLQQAILYPGVGLIEFTNVSVGRGTHSPFERIGAPYIDAEKLAKRLNAYRLPGVQFKTTHFTPQSSVFAKQKCHGVQIILTDRQVYQSLDTGLILARTLMHLYPKQFDPQKKLNTLLLHPPTIKALREQRPLQDIRQLWQADLKKFHQRRQRYLLYP
ncbi:MAG: DUF1343 domain-containing protein [Verrucomicrobiales bacterium]|nr:DUF1343 domain-containing protein [Verrucomicrobiales bacterium]